MLGAGPKASGKTGGPSPLVKLAIAAGFAVLLIGISIGVIRAFVIAPNKTIIILPPEVTQQAQAVAQPIRQIGPRAVALRPTFTGNVVDAQTHEPIQNFSVRLGYSFNNGNFNNQPPNFTSQNTKQFHNGHYSITSVFSVGNNNWYVRIDAPGHRPMMSSALRGSGTQNFELQAGKDVTGRVLDATGAPVTGAAVVLATQGIQGGIDPANPREQRGNSFQTVSDAQGNFDFSPQTDQIVVAAFNDTGFGQVSQEASDSKIEIHMAAWGIIQGQLMVGGKSRPNAQIELYSMDPYLYKMSSTQTDADGHFHFDRAVPGTAQLARLAQQKMGQGYMVLQTQTTPAQVVSGKTITVNIGGVGRPVAGRLVLPSGINFKDYYVQGNINGTSTPVSTEFPPTMPDKVKNGSQAARDMWMQFFGLTVTGRAYLQAHPQPQPVDLQYAMEMGGGGHFRIEDVVPGDYQGWIYLRSAQGGPINFQPQQIQFTVPPVLGGYSADPLVIPDIHFKRN